jgi:hypothetical protein
MLVLGVVCLILALIFGIPVLSAIGIILIVVGIVLALLGMLDRSIGPRRYYLLGLDGRNGRLSCPASRGVAQPG